MTLKDIKSMTLQELKADFAGIGQPSFRALQVYRWLQARGAVSFDEMSDLSKELRGGLKERYYIAAAETERKFSSQTDGTVKYLFRMNDGELVESVLMRYHYGNSICISTQIGCRMNCSFCATGKSGYFRNLTASEMLAQIQAAQLDSGERVSHVVLMGMGEPLDNYNNVLRFLELVSSEEGLNLGMRHISLSTCGLVDRIYELAEKKLQLTLSVSLHAPNDRIRSQMMPVNRRWNMEQLLRACRAYVDRTGRRISFEYAMVDGVNDSTECARELSAKLKGMLCHVNLIPVNPVGDSPYRKSKREKMENFSRVLTKTGIPVTVRRTLGSDIDASCGQLRRRYKEEVANVEGIQKK